MAFPHGHGSYTLGVVVVVAAVIVSCLFLTHQTGDLNCNAQFINGVVETQKGVFCTFLLAFVGVSTIPNTVWYAALIGGAGKGWYY